MCVCGLWACAAKKNARNPVELMDPVELMKQALNPQFSCCFFFWVDFVEIVISRTMQI